MIAAALMMLQAAGPAAPDMDPSRASAPHPKATHSCAAQDDDSGDIVVCGRLDANEQYRLRPLTSRYDPVVGPGIGMRIGKGQANLYAASGQSSDGKPDKRIMVTLKLPF
jgi:hypothetical protein